MPEHPRVRGENIDAALVESAIQGTSPRARGKLLLVTPIPTTGRNIPACAGKTNKRATVTVNLPEHPRVRGENRTP